MDMPTTEIDIKSLVAPNLRTTSRIIAQVFEKQHNHVLRDIRDLIAANPAWGVLNFEETPYVDPQNGQTYQMYEITRDGYTMLAMGFTGRKAMDWKIKFLAAFNAMEEQLRHDTRSATIDLNDPSQLVPLFTAYAQRTQTAKARVVEMSQKADALDWLDAMDGAPSIRPAAKVLGVPEHKLRTWLQMNRWAFRQNGKGPLQAHVDKRNCGYLDHKPGEYIGRDGEARISIALMITPKGMARLAKIFNLECVA